MCPRRAAAFVSAAIADATPTEVVVTLDSAITTGSTAPGEWAVDVAGSVSNGRVLPRNTHLIQYSSERVVS